MRPIKLEICAFGPYSSETVFELDRLGNKGIYLITGDTGAGKTTIFDAITYALYGNPSGNNREPKMLRSKYASEDVPTYVTLIFEYAGKQYHIYRSPEYERPTKKTPHKTEVILTMPDGKTYTQIAEVNNMVKRIIGIDRNQFTQIAMIAQGEFLKLLLATTEERQKIFRDLFKTNYYQTIQEKLKIEMLELGKQCSLLRNRVKQDVEGIKYPENDSLELDVQKALNEELTIEEVMALVDSLLTQDEKWKEETESAKGTLENEILIINQKIERIRIYNKLLNEINECQERLIVEQDKNKAVKDKLFQIQEKEEEVDNWKHEIQRIIDSFPKYEEIEIKEEVLIKTEEKIKEEEKQRTDLQKQIKELGEQEELEKKEYEELKGCETEVIRIEQYQNDIITSLEAILELENEIIVCNDEGKELKKLQEVYCEISEKAKEIKERYNSCYQRYLDEQAGILALDLKEEQPCPVCGSTIHPQIAEIMKGAPTKEELEQLKRQSELAEATARDKSNICAQKQVHITTIKEQIKKKIMKIWQVEQTLEEAANRCVMDKKEKEVQKQEVFAKLSEAKQRVFRFQKLEQSIPVINKQLENGQNQIHELTLKIKSALMEQQHLKKEIENLHGCMQYRSLQEAKKETTQKQLAIQKFNRESEYAKRQVELSNQELNTLMGKIDSLKEQVAATQTESYEGLHVRLEELLNSKAIVEEKYLQINERYVRNQEASNNIRKYSEQLKKIETRYQWVRSLSNTANGDLNGKERIKLETFIQMNYFDRIINHANVRFMVMSNGQYELKRKMESSNKGKQSGLDLDVIDHYNGSIRSVKTLSGGESFMASLSLALGLSDEVQRSAGGIQLNTMFVDEGFGALDEETLNLAIRTLTNLSEQNRLIGIISHVAELKEKIDHQIVVKKDKYSGSKVEIIV